MVFECLVGASREDGPGCCRPLGIVRDGQPDQRHRDQTHPVQGVLTVPERITFVVAVGEGFFECFMVFLMVVVGGRGRSLVLRVVPRCTYIGVERNDDVEPDELKGEEQEYRKMHRGP